MEKPFFFKNCHDSMFGVLHTPDGNTPREGLVLCHAFGEEKLWSHRVFVNTAREATKRGLAVFRFDFRGHGDSHGHTESFSVEDYLSDIDAAIAAFRIECPSIDKIGLLGLRLGGSLALLHASRSSGCARLAIWEPIMDGDRYIQELLRINLGTQLAVYGKVVHNRESLVAQMQSGSYANVDGYLISNTFYEDCKSMNLLGLGHCKADMQILVAQIAPNIKQDDRADLIELTSRRAATEFLKVEEPPFWREIKPFTSRTKGLINETLNWWANDTSC